MSKRLYRNILSDHPGLMWSSMVQAQMALRSARALSGLIVRSFDDGRDVEPTRVVPTPEGGGVSQYDVLAANPGLNLSVYEDVSYATTTDGSDGRNGHEYDVADANPRFDPTLYEAETDDPREAQTGGDRPTAPMPSADDSPSAPPSLQAPAQKPAATSNQTGLKTPVAKAGSFTARELGKLVQDQEFKDDLDAILSAAGGKVDQPATLQATRPASTARRQSTGREAKPGPDQAGTRTSTPEAAAQEIFDAPGEHAIFDKIAEKMQFATAYELPAVNLSRRFDTFDRQGPRRPPAARFDALSTQATVPAQAAPAPSDPPKDEAPAPADDRSDAQPEESRDVAPVVVQTLRPSSETEKVAIYGDPRVDSEAWVEQNVVSVQVPQLVGVPGPDGVPFDGAVAFHRLGMRSLGDLFAAWETAGLMDKVMSFDGSHAARSPHGEGVDAHAWAIAFDINAKWNPAGEEPLPAGTEGSVAELVEIANGHGFVWGGHDPRRKAGLHFELGQRV